jgi:hypothetical protein
MLNTPKKIIIHCSDVSYKTIPDQFESINAYHRDRGFLRSQAGYFVGYHRLITGGKNYQCKEDFEEGCHCNQTYTDNVSMNLRSLGVCVGFDGDIEFPPVKEYEILRKQVWDWMNKYHLTPDDVVFHRTYATNKTCAGSLLDQKWLNTLLSSYAPQVSPASPPQPENKPAEQCEKQEAIISKQSETIGLFQRLVNLLMPK